jgi:hypothetical protein
LSWRCLRSKCRTGAPARTASGCTVSSLPDPRRCSLLARQRSDAAVDAG